MPYILSSLIGYALGSIPTTYLMLKWQKGIDITKNGSGNVGALNSLRVSKSKPIAASVFMIDLMKGWISVLIVASIYPGDYIFPMITLIAAVLAHSYSPWINFKGGRGLATAAGGGLFLSPIILVLWILLWLISYLVKNNSHIANFAASLFSPIISFVAGDFLNSHSAIHAINNLQFGTSLSILFIIILTKHIQPLRSLM